MNCIQILQKYLNTNTLFCNLKRNIYDSPLNVQNILHLFIHKIKSFFCSVDIYYDNLKYFFM